VEWRQASFRLPAQAPCHWIVPAPLVGKDVPEGVQWTMRHVPHYAQWQRFITYWTSADNNARARRA
jgi:hypothetical protein